MVSQFRDSLFRETVSLFAFREVPLTLRHRYADFWDQTLNLIKTEKLKA